MKNKVVLVGAPGVGKTSFYLCVMRQFKNFKNNRVLAYQPTIGTVYGQLQTYVDDSSQVTHVCPTFDTSYQGVKGIKIDLWDTAGQERFKSLLPMYMRNAIVAVVMHDNTNISLKRAAEEIREAKKAMPCVKIFVIQTKSDIGEPFNYKFIQENVVDKWAFICTIGKTLDSVDDAMLSISKLVHDTVKQIAVKETTPLLLATSSSESKKCCHKL